MTARAGTSALVAALLLVGLGWVPATRAAFTDRASVDSGTVTSGSMTTPATPTVAQRSGTGSTRVSWTASRVGTLGGVPTAYEVYRYAVATGGTPVLACSVTVADGAALACEDPSPVGGTVHYAVRATFGDHWRAESSRRSFAADRTGPVVAVGEPPDGFRGGANALRREVSRGCGSDVPACGTASDAAGVSSVVWTLTVAGTGPRATTRCWNGTRFTDQPASGSCPQAAATTSATTDGLRWTVPGSVDDVYRDRGDYTLTVVATDAFANVTTTTVSVTAT